MVYAIGPAGTGAAAWKAVQAALDDRLELRAVRLPGRENRFRERALTTVAEQVDDILTHLDADLATDRRPYLVAGACSGALTAYELARRVEADTRLPSPSLLCPIGHLPPARWHAMPKDMVHGYPTEALKSWLKAEGAVPDIALALEVFEVFEPMLRADLAAVETYLHRPLPMLRCAVAPVFGANDDRLNDDRINGWAEVTSGPFWTSRIVARRDLPRDAPESLAATLASIYGRLRSESNLIYGTSTTP